MNFDYQFRLTEDFKKLFEEDPPETASVNDIIDHLDLHSYQPYDVYFNTQIMMTAMKTKYSGMVYKLFVRYLYLALTVSDRSVHGTDDT